MFSILFRVIYGTSLLTSCVNLSSGDCWIDSTWFIFGKVVDPWVITSYFHDDTGCPLSQTISFHKDISKYNVYYLCDHVRWLVSNLATWCQCSTCRPTFATHVGRIHFKKWTTKYFPISCTYHSQQAIAMNILPDISFSKKHISS